MLPKVTDGLKSLSGVTAGHGYAEAVVKFSTASGAAVRAEAGWVPRDGLRLYGYGEASRLGAEAGLGAKWTF